MSTIALRTLIAHAGIAAAAPRNCQPRTRGGRINMDVAAADKAVWQAAAAASGFTLTGWLEAAAADRVKAERDRLAADPRFAAWATIQQPQRRALKPGCSYRCTPDLPCMVSRDGCCEVPA